MSDAPVTNPLAKALAGGDRPADNSPLLVLPEDQFREDGTIVYPTLDLVGRRLNFHPPYGNAKFDATLRGVSEDGSTVMFANDALSPAVTAMLWEDFVSVRVSAADTGLPPGARLEAEIQADGIAEERARSTRARARK